MKSRKKTEKQIIQVIELQKETNYQGNEEEPEEIQERSIEDRHVVENSDDTKIEETHRKGEEKTEERQTEKILRRSERARKRPERKFN